MIPENPALLAQLGAAYQRLGQSDDARVWYERAQALAGDDPRYTALLDSLNAAEDAALDTLLQSLETSLAHGAP